MRILVDTSARLQHASTHTPEWQSFGKKVWGNHLVDTGGLVSRFQPTKLRDSKGGMQVFALAAIVEKFLAGELQAFSTDALDLEYHSQMQLYQRQHGHRLGTRYGDVMLLSVVNYQKISTFGLGGYFLDPENGLLLLRSILKTIRDLPYRTIVDAFKEKSMSNKNSQDAWHLHCCEIHELDMFLTIDTRLLDLIRQLPPSEMKRKLESRAVLPTTACKKLGIEPLDLERFDALAMKLGAFPRFGSDQIDH
jgi:hypothetical protein